MVNKLDHNCGSPGSLRPYSSAKKKSPFVIFASGNISVHLSIGVFPCPWGFPQMVCFLGEKWTWWCSGGLFELVNLHGHGNAQAMPSYCPGACVAAKKAILESATWRVRAKMWSINCLELHVHMYREREYLHAHAFALSLSLYMCIYIVYSYSFIQTHVCNDILRRAHTFGVVVGKTQAQWTMKVSSPAIELHRQWDDLGMPQWTLSVELGFNELLLVNMLVDYINYIVKINFIMFVFSMSYCL